MSRPINPLATAVPMYSWWTYQPFQLDKLYGKLKMSDKMCIFCEKVSNLETTLEHNSFQL